MGLRWSRNCRWIMLVNWFQAEATLQYYEEYLVAYVDQGIADFYRSLIPKSHYVCGQRWPAHITVIREGMIPPNKSRFWGRYDRKKVKIQYSPITQMKSDYYWLNVVSKDLEKIYAELGMEFRIYDEHKPPEGFRKFFHITIGNTKYRKI